MATKRVLSLTLTAFVCCILILPLMIAWVVNVDVAIRAVDAGWTGLSTGLPPSLYSLAEKVSVDYSTVSTLVPVLLFLFPLVMSVRINLKQKANPDYVYLLEWDPYPPQFPFFLVMLGLTGTLYGLFIGLDVSGVAELGQATASAESIRATIDRLLDGTATALLSSLVGLIGAFLAARPLTWIFRRLAFIPTGEDHQPLSDTLATLNRDLMELARSSREFSERLNSGAVEGIAGHMSEIRAALEAIARSMNETNERVGETVRINAEISTKLEPLAHLPQLDRLDDLRRLESIETDVNEINPALTSSARELEQLHADELAAFARIEQGARTNSERIAELTAQTDRLAESLERIRTEAGGERRAFKAALSEYVAEGGASRGRENE